MVAQGHLVVGARRHVAEMRRRHVLFHDRLKIKNVERLGRVGDQFIDIARGPIHRIRWPQPFGPGGSRDQRTCRQKLQKTATAGDVNVMRQHHCPQRKRYLLNSGDGARCIAPCWIQLIWP
jgi:hypothetical protein